MAQVVSSLALFALAGLCEIGGGYLIWQWWRNGANWASEPSARWCCFSMALFQPISRRTSGGSRPPMEEFLLHFQLFGDGVWTASRQIGMIY